MEPNDYLTIREVSQLLRVSTRTVRRAIRAQRLAVVYLSARSLRVSRAAVLAMLHRPTPERKKSPCDP